MAALHTLQHASGAEQSLQYFLLSNQMIHREMITAETTSPVNFILDCKAGAPSALISVCATDDYEAAVGSLLSGGVPSVCQQALQRIAEGLHCARETIRFGIR